MAVEFVKAPMRENTTKYGGTGYKKVETSLDFEPAPVADPEFTEQYRRKDPCNCTLNNFKSLLSCVFIRVIDLRSDDMTEDRQH